MRHRRTSPLVALALLLLFIPAAARAQYATAGVGVLAGDGVLEPVAELHAASAPVRDTRGYVTLSWTDQSAIPTTITAAERSIVSGRVLVGLGAGLLWLESNSYEPYPILVSSTVVPLTVPRTAVVAIVSTQPFQDFAWSVVLKVGVTLWSR